MFFIDTIILFQKKKQAETSPETRQRIADIIRDRYNNYGGVYGDKIRQIHSMLRILNSDNEFLAFLENCTTNNPKPVLHLSAENNPVDIDNAFHPNETL